MVSIILSVYNTHEHLSAAVESVLCQTCADWELILVDDGSTDGSEVICDRFATLDSRIRVIHQENRGLSVPTWINGSSFSNKRTENRKAPSII